ncbi:MAG: glycosyltransferase [Candidatus Omnitrophota bacterium]|jgi:glycosyltransferase involved in cell wall biosynthesis
MTNRPPYFSVIIPFYNKEACIEDCLDSILRQDFPRDDYEIICVNNNSTDNSASIVKKYPSIKLVHEKIQNAYVARNTGILNSRGSVMVFTDADTQVPHDWLGNIYFSIKKNGYDIVIGWYSPGRRIRLLEIHSLLISERIKKAIKEKNPSMLTAGANNLTIKKEIFEKEGLFLNNSNSEDMYLVIRCMIKGYNIGFQDNITIKRNDIDSISILMLKNFIYGCSNAMDIACKLSFTGKLKYVLITLKFIFRYFPTGAGLLLFTFSYFTGYILSKSGLLTPRIIAGFIHKYTLFINKISV